MSRRLKHLKVSYSFFVKTNQHQFLENKIIQNVDEFVVLEKKYALKGHTKENDIKKIEKTVKSDEYSDGYLFKLNIHIHHYTKFYFNINEFIYFLKELLGCDILYPVSSSNPTPELKKQEPVAEQQVEEQVAEEKQQKSLFG